MLLGELVAASGVSAASIKYYRREGLLPAGERVTATRQDYGQRHLERLDLIQVLREVAGASITQIARLTAILDDPERTLLDALAAAQELSLGVADQDGPDPGEPPAEHPSIAPLLEELGWPDADSSPRRALDELLRSLDTWGAPTSLPLLRRYAEPMAEIARADVAWMQDQPGSPLSAEPSEAEPSEAEPPTVERPSPDVQVMRAVSGTVAFDRLVQILRALGHASVSILGADGEASRERPASPQRFLRKPGST